VSIIVLPLLHQSMISGSGCNSAEYTELWDDSLVDQSCLQPKNYCALPAAVWRKSSDGYTFCIYSMKLCLILHNNS